jgi:hypothetical protein
MPDVQVPAANTQEPSPATFKASGQTSEPDATLQPGAFEADIEGLESFEDEPEHATSLSKPPATLPASKAQPNKSRAVKPPAAKAPATKAAGTTAADKPHARSFSVLWPVLLIAAGAVLLLTNLGYVPEISWGQLWRFWPVLLIAMGIDTLFSRRSLFGSIIGALLILTLLGGVIYVVAFAP